MEINTVIERLLNESKELESAFTSLHIETVKAEKTMTEALNKEEMDTARHHYKLLQKIEFESGQLLESLSRLKVLYISLMNVKEGVVGHTPPNWGFEMRGERGEVQRLTTSQFFRINGAFRKWKKGNDKKNKNPCSL